MYGPVSPSNDIDSFVSNTKSLNVSYFMKKNFIAPKAINLALLSNSFLESFCLFVRCVLVLCPAFSQVPMGLLQDVKANNKSFFIINILVIFFN